MYKNKIFSIYIILIALLMLSCENVQEKNSNKKDNIPLMGSGSLGEIINKMVYNESTGTIDAFQISAKSFGVYNIEDSNYVDMADDFALAYYKVGSTADFIEYSKCLNFDLIPKVGQFPHRYFLDWSNNPISFGQNIIWKFKYPSLSEVQTSVPMPQDFGNLQVNTSYLDPSQGCIISWGNTGSEDLVLVATLAYKKNDNDIMGGTKIKFIDFIPNSGTYVVTPQFLNDIGVDSLCINVAFYFGKANIKIDKYDNDTKQVATVGYIEKTIAIPTIYSQ